VRRSRYETSTSKCDNGARSRIQGNRGTDGKAQVLSRQNAAPPQAGPLTRMAADRVEVSYDLDA
jgi:hypothetical protein